MGRYGGNPTPPPPPVLDSKHRAARCFFAVKKEMEKKVIYQRMRHKKLDLFHRAPFSPWIQKKKKRPLTSGASVSARLPLFFWGFFFGFGFAPFLVWLGISQTGSETRELDQKGIGPFFSFSLFFSFPYISGPATKYRIVNSRIIPYLTLPYRSP